MGPAGDTSRLVTLRKQAAIEGAVVIAEKHFLPAFAALSRVAMTTNIIALFILLHAERVGKVARAVFGA